MLHDFQHQKTVFELKAAVFIGFFEVLENFREIQDILNFCFKLRMTQGTFDFYKNLRADFFLDLE